MKLVQGYRKIFVLLIICFSSAQITDHSESFTIAESSKKMIVTMGGFLDGENTFSYRNNPELESVFQPMQCLRLTNEGTTIIDAPRININNKKRWFDFDSMINEIFESAESNKDRALSVWKLLSDNSIHFNTPEDGCNIADPVKFLTIYGYMTCGCASEIITSIAKMLHYDGRAWYMNDSDNSHVVPEINFGDGFVIIDSDAKVFYLDYDNRTLLGKSQVTEDKFLIRRTHHFGKCGNSSYDMCKLYNGKNALAGPSDCSGHTLDIPLRPGESLVYDWKDAAWFHHVCQPVPKTIPKILANNRIEYKPVFKKAPLNQLVNHSKNIMISQTSPFVHAETIGDDAYFEIRILSPGVILDGSIRVAGKCGSQDDIVLLEYSNNYTTWQTVKTFNKAGEFKESLVLSAFLSSLAFEASHTYFIRFRFMPGKTADACGIDSLMITTSYQTSRFFMPELKIGRNAVTYNDRSSNDLRNIKLAIHWQESEGDRTPQQITRPVYPADNAELQKTQFTFSWDIPADPDGDEIMDYEFQLSDRSDMRFPLSPNFDRYISSISPDSIKPEFVVPWPGLFNAGTIYYWRVRSKDSYGAWSAWSPTWSFVTQGVMLPLDGTCIRKESELYLKWNQNSGGAAPACYHIHGSNIANGFTPDSSTYIATTFENDYKITNKNYAFYRIVAVDSNGFCSGPSRVITSGIMAEQPVRDLFPSGFTLWQNYPNPFNASTVIEFSIPESANVIIEIWDLQGNRIACLFNDHFTGGIHRTVWNGLDDQGKNIASGVYLYRMQSGNFTQTKKMIKLQ